jgi:translation initiation factor 4E
MAAVGEQFDVGDEVCGIVVSIRFQEDIISIWNKTSSDRDAKGKI